MKVFKLVFGLILGIAAIVTILGMLGEEQGAGLGGALTGFVIIMAIAIWLIFSAIKGFEKQSLKNTEKKNMKNLGCKISRIKIFNRFHMQKIRKLLI